MSANSIRCADCGALLRGPDLVCCPACRQHREEIARQSQATRLEWRELTWSLARNEAMKIMRKVERNDP